jgi:3',5'-cyclic AMP phosphodiesterase CpdA
MRIAFITDIHIGATAAGWQQQPRWCEGIPAVLAALAARLAELRPDLLIIGGDIVENAAADAVNGAVSALRDLPCPTLVCLGNHDLTEPASYPFWRRALWDWPRATLADRMLEFPECDVIGLNNHWLDGGEAKLFWNRQMPAATLTADQLRQLDAWLARRSDRPAVLAMHAPLFPLPPQLTGRAEPSDVPPPAYAEEVKALLQRHRRLRLVLSGHCHAACATPLSGSCTHLSATSLTEVPFQFPLVEVSPRGVSVRTEQLGLSGGAAMNSEKAWVMGRGADRQFALHQ